MAGVNGMHYGIDCKPKIEKRVKLPSIFLGMKSEIADIFYNLHVTAFDPYE